MATTVYEIFDEHVPVVDPDHEFVAMIGFVDKVFILPMSRNRLATLNNMIFSV